MENIKSAEEVIESVTGRDFDWEAIYTLKCSEITDMLHEYAAQFQPKWIEGAPEIDEQGITPYHCLLSNQTIVYGAYDGKWIDINGENMEEVQPNKVLAYAEIIKPSIPDHLKAKIK